MSDLSKIVINDLYSGQIDDICIDNIAPDVGYSFLYTEGGALYHCFSYGMLYGVKPWYTKMDSIMTYTINPSIAYKQYRFLYVDYIWMEDNGNGFNIYHKRADKHKWVGIEDHEIDKGYTIIGYPNPFRERITIEIKAITETAPPTIRIYNINSQMLRTLPARTISTNHYSFDWDAKDNSGNMVEPGIYINCLSLSVK